MVGESGVIPTLSIMPYKNSYTKNRSREQVSNQDYN